MASISLAPLSLNEGSAVTLLDVLPFVFTSVGVDSLPLWTVASLRRTCKKIKRLIDPLITKIKIPAMKLDAVCASNSFLLRQATTVDFLSKGLFSQTCGRVFELYLPRMTSFTAHMFQYSTFYSCPLLLQLAWARWPKLKHLMLHNVEIVGSADILLFAEARWLKNLETFELTNPTLLDEQGYGRMLPAHISPLLKAFNGSNVRVLHLGGIYAQCFRSFEGLSLPELEKLELGFCEEREGQLQEFSIDPLLKANLPKLRTLSITTQTSLHLLPVLIDSDEKIFPNLEDLSLDLRSISFESLKFLGTEFVLNGLKSLHLFAYKQLQEFDTLDVLLGAPEPAAHAMQPAPALEKLKIDCYPSGLPDTFYAHLKNLNKLKSVCIGESDSIWSVFGSFKPTGAVIELGLSAAGVGKFLTFAEDFELSKIKEQYRSQFCETPEEVIHQAKLDLSARYPTAVVEELPPPMPDWDDYEEEEHEEEDEDEEYSD